MDKQKDRWIDKYKDKEMHIDRLIKRYTYGWINIKIDRYIEY